MSHGVAGTREAELTFRCLEPDTLADFKLLNRALFPVNYSERFYRECRASGRLTQLAFAGSELLGAVACRLEPQPDGADKLYIMTLGVYARHRGRGIGSQLLERVLRHAREQRLAVEAYLHVQVTNEEAIGFYSRRGFAVGGTIQNYYRRIETPHAVVLRKQLLQRPL